MACGSLSIRPGFISFNFETFCDSSYPNSARRTFRTGKLGGHWESSPLNRFRFEPCSGSIVEDQQKRKRNENVSHFESDVCRTDSSAFAQSGTHTSSHFQGPKANTGTVTHSHQDGKSVLTLSDDFVVPDTPDPHWQVVDSDGKVYLLDKLKTKAFIGTNYKKEIVLPSYVKNVAKVQIWCAFAEVNLGEASFSSPVM
jgi:hypothetical protein